VSETRSGGAGLAFAVSAYTLWGLLPLYFASLAPAGAFEVVAWRVLFSLVLCALLLTITRGWSAFAALATNRRTALIMGAAGVFILINWVVYVFAALTGHIIEASLGYFTNPIVTVLLGVLVLRERLRPLQWIAIGLSVVAVLVLAINYGSFPWIALVLAFSFGLYGFIKKQVGGSVDAISGLTIETLWLAPLAIGAVVVIALNGELVIGTAGVGNTVLLLFAGAVTAVPLLLFASAARRLSLVSLGLTQYFAPVIQFLIGVYLFHEDMPLARWIGFTLVWIALVVLTIDLVRNQRALRRATLEPV
jgi:chloramphenicol-sensitive protein RarD